MKNQVFTISAADLNTHLPHVYNCGLAKGSDVPALFKRVWFKNTTGIDITITFLATLEEWQEWQKDSSTFVGIPIANGAEFDQNKYLGALSFEIPQHSIIVSGVASTATSALSVYCINYV